MSSLLARGVTRTYGPAVLVEGIDLTVAPGDRIGLVGANGAGKTTLLRALAGIDPLDGGSIRRTPATTTVGYLPQEPERRPGETLRMFLRRRTGVGDAEAMLERTAEALGSGGGEDAYSSALERYLALGGPDLDARAGAVLAELGLPVATLDQQMSHLSGGQAARASLASLLVARFDVFLLDEPTNDLDLDGLERLEAWVRALDAGLVVVSHDREFLERTVRSVLELDEVTHRGALFNGGWLAYLEARATARRHAEDAYDAFVDRRDSLRRRAQQQREWAQQGQSKVRRSGEPDKHIRHFKTVQTEKLAGKARATERQLERLDVVDKPWEGWELHLSIASSGRSGDVVVRLREAVVRRGAFALGPLDLEIGWGERIGILGPNGSGKTTLLDAILGRIPLAGGSRWFGPGVVVGELDQRRRRFLADGALLETFGGEAGLLPQEARSLLAKFGLGAEHVARPASTLSPGERTRTELALLMARGVNCLVLDEPTNHLDLPAIEQLEHALATWDGTLVLVTHDRRLLASVELTREIRLG
ncbi:MAG TPA: ABC-F family ATP-binding cassette domain-containing protein [Acidimicrobiales bacterium]|nr:ABC-F family ATP-binding cassette domain-containing protein [Acidimicrobiales bacterium]